MYDAQGLAGTAGTAEQAHVAECDRSQSCVEITSLHERPDILDQLRAGDRDVLGRIYVRHAPDVLRLLRTGFPLRGRVSARIPGLSDRATRQDVLQEVFLKAFDTRVLGAYDPSRAYVPFLLQIARYVHIDQARARQREARLKKESLLDGHLSAVTPVARFGEYQQNAPDASIDRARISTMVQELRLELRRYYDLRYAEDLPQTDVARQMGISRRHARTLESELIYTCRQRLRAELAVRRSTHNRVSTVLSSGTTENRQSGRFVDASRASDAGRGGAVVAVEAE